MVNGSVDAIDNEVQFNSALHGILHKLSLLLDQEADALRSGRHQVLEEYARKKISLFSQLRVLHNRYRNIEMTQLNVNETRKLKAKLSANMQKLELTMSAIKELTSTIEQAVLSDQSDGTYTVGAMAMRGYV